jgi:hypothetical protein
VFEGMLGNFCCAGGAGHLGKAQKSRGAETLLETMVKLR